MRSYPAWSWDLPGLPAPCWVFFSSGCCERETWAERQRFHCIGSHIDSCLSRFPPSPSQFTSEHPGDPFDGLACHLVPWTPGEGSAEQGKPRDQMSFKPGDFSVRPLATSGIDAGSHPLCQNGRRAAHPATLTQAQVPGAEGSTLGLMLCCFILNFLILSEPEGPHLHFILGPANPVALPDAERACRAVCAPTHSQSAAERMAAVLLGSL